MTSPSSKKIRTERTHGLLADVYETVASEYYDTVRHPTCANFRRGSERIISRWLPRGDQHIVEVGCGLSTVAELLRSFGCTLRALRLVDSSRTMLDYSRQFETFGAELIASDAEQLALHDHSADVLVASLGDPFNTEAFWINARRVVRPGGQIVFTTPSFEWSSLFRRNMNHPADAAEFVTRDGARIFLPSFVLSPEQQIRWLDRLGLNLLAVEHVTLRELGVVHLSPKLRGMRDGGPVVTGYVCSV